MKTAKLGEISRPKQWRTISKSEMTPAGYPVYGANGVIGYAADFTHPEPTIAIGCRGTIGSVHITEPHAFVTSNAMALDDIDTERVDQRYLARFLTWRGFHDVTSGTSQPQLTRQNLVTVVVPLPSMDEQRRIAWILDRADAIRAKRRQVLTHLGSLPESIFVAMFGREEPSVTVGDVAEIQGGLQVTAKRAALPHEVPYLRVANVHRGRLDLSEVKTMRVTEAEATRTALARHDLLFVEGHANPEEVGRVALWTGEIDGCVHQNHLIRARVDPTRVEPLFAATWLNTNRGARHLRRGGKTTSGLNTISASTVRTAPMLLPPLKAQREFAARAERVYERTVAIQKARAVDDELFASLQSLAFRGEL